MCNLNNKKIKNAKQTFLHLLITDWISLSGIVYLLSLAPKSLFSLAPFKSEVTQERREQFSQFSSAGNLFFYIFLHGTFSVFRFIPKVRWFLYFFSVFFLSSPRFSLLKRNAKVRSRISLKNWSWKQLLALDAVIYVCSEIKPIIAIKFVIKYGDSLSAHNAATLLQK